MSKRKVGERAEILFDSIDLDILKTLNEARNRYGGYYEGLGILDLAQKLNLKHKNLKPHIDKLLALDLIFAWKDEQKIRIGTEMENVKDLDEEMFEKKEWKEMQEETKEQRALLKYLEKSKQQQYKSKLAKDIEFDLRKKKNIEGINYKSELKRLQKNEQITKEVIEEYDDRELKKLNLKRVKKKSEVKK